MSIDKDELACTPDASPLRGRLYGGTLIQAPLGVEAVSIFRCARCEALRKACAASLSPSSLVTIGLPTRPSTPSETQDWKLTRRIPRHQLSTPHRMGARISERDFRNAFLAPPLLI